MAERPSRPLAWAFGAASGDVVEPPSGLAEAGWQPDQTVPAPYLNFLLSLTGQWIEFLRGPNVGTWARNAWGTSPATFDTAITRLAAAVDTATPDGTAACYRYACISEESGPTTTMRVSQTGEAWERRTNVPSGVVAPFVLHTDGTRWILASGGGGGGYQVDTTVVDSGAGTGAMGSGGGSWAGASLDATLSEPKAIASHGGRSVLWTASEAFYSDDHGQTWTSYVLSGTARSGDGRDVVHDGTKWVAITQSGQVYASSDGITFTYKATLGISGAWQLAAGETGEVVAYRLGSSSSVDLYRSTNSGSSWSAVTPSGSSLPKYITALRYQSGAWLATSSAAPWLWTSTDLVAWLALRAPAASTTSSKLFALLFEGGRWLALGNGVALTSGRAADPMPGAYVPGSLPAYLADAGYLRGLEVSDATPSDGEVLTWSDSLGQWVPAAGGGGSLPVADPADLIAGATASRLVGTDGSGDGVLLTAAQTAALIGVTSRRPAATADTRLLYELTQTSGNVLNTGSLGASGDLSEIGSSVVRSADLSSVWGGDVVMPGDSNSYIRGAAGLALTSTTQLTMWCVAKIRSGPASRKSIFTRNHATWGGYPYISAALVAAPSGAWYVEIGRVSPGYTEFHATTNYVLDTIHLFGLTYDGTTLRAWLDGAAAGSASAPGAIDWGPGTGKWELGSNGGNERPVATLYRAGVEETVWDAAAWSSFYAKLRGVG